MADSEEWQDSGTSVLEDGIYSRLLPITGKDRVSLYAGGHLIA